MLAEFDRQWLSYDIYWLVHWEELRSYCVLGDIIKQAGTGQNSATAYHKDKYSTALIVFNSLSRNYDHRREFFPQTQHTVEP